MKKWVLPILLILGLPGLMFTQVPFDTSPDWISADVSSRSTGAAWADIDRDGWMDLVVANGNDMARQRVAVYYNDGAGLLQVMPDWQSSDIDYHGHCSVGDVNNDGFPDVAVSVYIGAAGFSQRGKVKLYMNNNGTLESLPSWESGEPIYSFSCALGDADGDGDLDLAVAGGEAYNHNPEQNRIYYNQNGILDSDPGWRAAAFGYSYDVTWADFDNDGDLDLVFANEFGPNAMYENNGDSLNTIPVWNSTDPGAHANSLFCADIDNDGDVDLGVSDNNQLGGEGRFKLYRNNGGILETVPFWTSEFSGYGSGITLADIDGDGDTDLVAGGWWEPCRIYLNGSGGFPAVPDWTSLTGSVAEAIVLADCDNDGLDTLSFEFSGDGERKLFRISQTPLQHILDVAVAGDTLGLAEYCSHLESGWISCASPVPAGDVIQIKAVISHDLDCAVSNWDASIGNYLFFNTSATVNVAYEQDLPSGMILYQNYPNPFNPITSIRFGVWPARSGGDVSHPSPGRVGFVSLSVYDLLGRKAATLVAGDLDAGYHTVQFDGAGLASGLYIYVLRVDGFVESKRAMLIR